MEKGMKMPESKLPRFPDPVHQKRDFAAERILKVWLETPFAGGRHAARVAKIDAGGSEVM